MGYTLRDTPYARGEVLVRSNESGDGYYKEAELTKENFTADGWFRTGDIGTLYMSV